MLAVNNGSSFTLNREEYEGVEVHLVNFPTLKKLSLEFGGLRNKFSANGDMPVDATELTFFFSILFS